MTTMCADQRHSPQLHHHLLSGKKPLRGIDNDVPPHRLLSRRPDNNNNTTDIFIYLPENSSSEEEALLRKFLPYNSTDEDSDSNSYSDPYSSDEFRMYEFKVRRCMRSRSHDWTNCPFAHPGEKAKRRDPRRFHYSGHVCSDFRRGGCSHGDACEFAHGVFECWLHPSRYRTQACKDGKNCKRKVCFFAHTPRQLRVLPLMNSQQPHSPQSNSVSSPSASSINHCCVLCHSIASSPTSTLMGISHFSPPLSPSLSPPRSQINNGGGFDGSRCGFSPLSRLANPSVLDQFLPGTLTYKDTLTELVSSLEAMDLGSTASSTTLTRFNNENLSWVNVSDEQQQFVLSPSTPQGSEFGFREFLNEDDYKYNYKNKNSFIDKNKSNNNNDDGWCCPDLEWVNELVM